MMRPAGIFTILLLGFLLAGCCVQHTPALPPVLPGQQNSSPPVVPPATPIPQVTAGTPPAPAYTTVEVVTDSGIRPATGFTLDYLSGWTETKEHRAWPAPASPVKEVTVQDQFRYWKAVYHFSSPDGRAYADVYFDEVSGTGDYFYPIDIWADGVIREKTRPYCLDGAGNPVDEDYCYDTQWTFYHPMLVSNDPVTISGSFESRRLAFTSYDDENYGMYTVHLMHSGQMEGYNFTITDHPEVAVPVPGPAWDFGRGGQAYAIDLSASADQVNATKDTFSHMIDSFEIA